MLSTFDVIDTELPDLKPDWMIREEIGRTAARIRSEAEAHAGSDAEANAGSDAEASDKMKSRLIEECYETYIKTNIMSETALNIILTDYLEAF
jgi:hypothetical protein